jgi:RimJ/RimL family protein N-acetyltransferase
MSTLPLPDPPLSDGDITLRPWREADAPALSELCQDAAIVRWTNVPANYTEKMARERVAQAEAERMAGQALILAVVGSSDEVLGACDLRLAADDPKRAEVAFMLGAPARGHGVMTRAVRVIARWAIEQLGVERVEALAHPENVASIAVAERAGFTKEGLLRGYRIKKMRREDRVVLSLLPRDAQPPDAR